MTDDRSAFTEARAVGKARSHEQRLAHRVERYCEVMHDAYEKAAVGAGWETQQVSRKPWADVPEANKVTMRAAVAVLLQAIDQERVKPCQPGCEFVAPHPSHPCGQYTRERP